MKSHYEVLGVSAGATAEQIRDAFRKRSVETHPDTGEGGGNREEFARVKAAYEVLRDAGRRARYDATGDDGAGAGVDDARTVCVRVFCAVLAQGFYAGADLVHETRRGIDAMHDRAKAELRGCESDLERLRKILAKISRVRGGEAVLEDVLESQIAKLEKVRGLTLQWIGAFEQALEILAGYGWAGVKEIGFEPGIEPEQPEPRRKPRRRRRAA